MYSRESVSCLLLRWWRWVMVRVSEGGSRRVPVSLACDGTMYACTCLNEDVECLPCSVRAVWSRRLCACRGSRVCRLWCLCGVVRVWLVGEGGVSRPRRSVRRLPVGVDL